MQGHFHPFYCDRLNMLGMECHRFSCFVNKNPPLYSRLTMGTSFRLLLDLIISVPPFTFFSTFVKGLKAMPNWATLKVNRTVIYFHFYNITV